MSMMSSLKTRPFITSITRSLKILRHSPTLDRRIASSAPRSFRRFPTGPDPQPNANGEITVPFGRAYVIQRNGKYLKTLYEGSHSLVPDLDQIVFKYRLRGYQKIIRLPIKASTSGYSSADEFWAEGYRGMEMAGEFWEEGDIGMEMDATISAVVVDPDLAFSNPCFSHFWKYGDDIISLDLSKDVQVQEILDRGISKMISEENIPRMIENRMSGPWSPYYKDIFGGVMKDLEVLDGLNAVITPRYGLKCEGLDEAQPLWLISPALRDRLLGADAQAAWSKAVDKYVEKVKSTSEYLIRRLEDTRTLEYGNVDYVHGCIMAAQGLQDLFYDLRYSRENIINEHNNLQKMVVHRKKIFVKK